MRRPAPGSRSEPAETPAATPLSDTAETGRAHGHTLAPWQVDGPDAKGHYEISSVDIKHTDGDYVASVYDARDARLIAAAPLMYAALKKIIAEVAQSPDIRLGSLFEADAAIAKAEGRS